MPGTDIAYAPTRVQAAPSRQRAISGRSIRSQTTVVLQPTRTMMPAIMPRYTGVLPGRGRGYYDSGSPTLVEGQ
eukprot:3624631-Rhodomonas_salina.1